MLGAAAGADPMGACKPGSMSAVRTLQEDTGSDIAWISSHKYRLPSKQMHKQRCMYKLYACCIQAS